MKKENYQKKSPDENAARFADFEQLKIAADRENEVNLTSSHSPMEKSIRDGKKEFDAAKLVAENFLLNFSAEEKNQLKKRLEELEDALLRARADYDNYRKRMDRERQESAELACESLIGELLPVLDNFERGIRAAEDPSCEHLVRGFSLIFDQLRQLLTARKVMPIGKVGEAFNPHQEDALSMVFHGEIPEGFIVEVIRPGYILGKKLLRPASVIVSKGKEIAQ